ncbi:hypothetical protein V8G54_011526 [Vigna mungo]|uniref:Serine-threonine/tyrosine-protein kinase catalytic domain-containing protein n=1 Tax=Vigna mungo TaxID=3915 RepID=A0AAQ3NRG8_VIGMU
MLLVMLRLMIARMLHKYWKLIIPRLLLCLICHLVTLSINYIIYMAPEYFMYGKVNDRIDVYAFGVVLLELLSRRKPISNDYPKGRESLVMWVPLFANLHSRTSSSLNFFLVSPTAVLFSLSEPKFLPHQCFFRSNFAIASCVD